MGITMSKDSFDIIKEIVETDYMSLKILSSFLFFHADFASMYKQVIVKNNREHTVRIKNAVSNSLNTTADCIRTGERSENSMI